MKLLSFLSKEKETSANTLNTFFEKIHALKPSDAFLLKGALFFCVGFLLFTLAEISMKYTVLTPAFGGTFREGIIGTPRFVNPVLAVTRADKDLTALIYDGLMRLGPDGVLIPNIAESVTPSADGLTYNVVIKQGVTFHDGSPLTASDVAFTILRIQDPILNSPLRASFDNVTVEEIGDYELNFILPEAYAPFIENLTFGILPEHIWKDAGSDEFPFSQYNSNPVGSGPYAVQEIKRNTSGIPEAYILKANTAYHHESPKIATIELHFLPTIEKAAQAYERGEIESIAGIASKNLEQFSKNNIPHHLERIPLPRTFALFINQNKSPALRDLAARKALNSAIDRTALVETVLGGYGNALTTPTPKGFGADIQEPLSEWGADKARDILQNGGWKLNEETQNWEKKIDDTLTPLEFSIATVNNGSLDTTAEFLKNAWSAIGAKVTIKQFEQSDLTQAVIRPRDYETLLFGTQLGRSLDYYPFWHSSQRNDPGLNVSLYANITTDSILSDIRRDIEGTQRTESLKRFVTELNTETPAIFLYTPELLYLFPDRVIGATFRGVSEPQERFSNVNEWYIQTESIWPFFKK